MLPSISTEALGFFYIQVRLFLRDKALPGKRRTAVVMLSLSEAVRVPAFQTVVLWLINALMLESCQWLWAFCLYILLYTCISH